VQLCQLLELSCQIRPSGRCRRCRRRRGGNLWRRGLLLLSLSVSNTLLIGQLLLLLRRRVLLRVLLLLMVGDGARRPGNYRGRGHDTCGTDQRSSSS
jgi:hypothetical protein